MACILQNCSARFSQPVVKLCCLLRRTGYKEPHSETNVRVMGGMSTYKEFYEVGAQLPSQVHSQRLKPVQLGSSR